MMPPPLTSFNCSVGSRTRAAVQFLAVLLVVLALPQVLEAQLPNWTFDPELKRLDGSGNELAGTVTVQRTDTIRLGVYLTITTDSDPAETTLNTDRVFSGSIHFLSSSPGLPSTALQSIVDSLPEDGSSWGAYPDIDQGAGTITGALPSEDSPENPLAFIDFGIDVPRGVRCEPATGDQTCTIFFGTLTIPLTALGANQTGELRFSYSRPRNSSDPAQSTHYSANVTVNQSNTVEYVIVAAPTLSTTPPTVARSTLILTYTRALDTNSVPANADFSVGVNGVAGARTVTGVEIVGSTVTLTLSSPVVAGDIVTVTYAPGTNPIRDTSGIAAPGLMNQMVTNNTLPELSIADAAAVEGEAIAFTVTLTPASSRPVTVQYETGDSGGTATEGTDYSRASGTLTFSASETSRTITVQTSEDPVDESDETFTVTLSNSSNATVATATATGTITDDDEESTEVTLSVNPTSVAEDDGATTVTVTATLDAGARTTPTDVSVTITGDTATTVDDFEAVDPFALTIPAGSTSGTETFTLTPVDDLIAEGPESLQVAGTVSGLTVNAATLSLTDDDEASTEVTLSVNPTSVAEDAGATTVTVTATLNEGARTSATDVTVAVSGDSATAGNDFEEVIAFTVTIPPNSKSGTGTFVLTPLDDSVAEGAERLTVTGIEDSGLTVRGTSLDLTDNDPPSTEVTLEVTPENIDENAGPTAVTVTATLNESARTSPTVVNVTVAGDTAVSATDFVAVTGFDLTIPAESESGTATFTLTPLDDSVAEGAESLQVNGTAQGLTVTSASLGLTDDDAAATGITLDVDPSSVREDAAATVVTVTATLVGNAGTSPTVVDVTVAGQTATAGTDFIAVGGFTVTIPAEETSGTGSFTLRPQDDSVVEGTETLSVDGSSGSLTVTSAVLDLTDDDTASTGLTLTVSPESVGEGDAPTEVTVTATLNGGAGTEPRTVDVTVTGNTATAGTDFNSVTPFTLTIPATQTTGTATFTLTPLNDVVTEGTETLAVNGSSAGLTVTPATLNLTDDDEPSTGVTLSVSPGSVGEGAGSTTVTVTAMLNEGARLSDTDVSVTVGSGSATEGTDYEAVDAFIVTIPAEMTSGTGTFTLVPLDDALAETTEELAVSGTVAGLAVTPAKMTLIDNDEPSTGVTLSVSPGSVGEGAGSMTVTVTATLDRSAATTATEVTVTVDGGTATPVTDYAAVSEFKLTIPAEMTDGTATFTLSPVDDSVAEGTETLTVSGTAGTLVVTPTTLNLTDDDTASTEVTLSASPDSVGEGAGSTTVTVTATLNEGARTTVTQVSVSVEGDTASPGDDFNAVRTFTVSIPAEMSSGTGTFTLTPVDDMVAEGTEQLTLSGTETGGLTVRSTTLDLTDNDSASTGVTLTLEPDSVMEDAGSTPVTVTATLNGSASTTATDVSVTVGGGTATPVDDYAAIDGITVTIPAEMTSGTGTFTLVPNDDIVAEGNETLLVSGTAGGLTVTAATLGLTDDDMASTAVTLTVSPDTVREDSTATTVTVTAQLNAGAGAAATEVTVTVAGGTATAGTDFAAVDSFAVTIAAGATSGMGTFTLTPMNDDVAEGTETIAVGGSAGALTLTPATLNLTDDDTPSTGVTLSVNPESVGEGDGAMMVTVTAALNGSPSASETQVTVVVVGETATAGTDFAAVDSFAVTIDAGRTSGTGTFTLTPVDDAVAEGTEIITVGGSAGALVVTTATLNLADDDTASTGVTLSVNPESVSEGAAPTTVTVTATLDASAGTSPTEVTVTVTGDTATVGDDFAVVNSFRVTIPAEMTSGTGTFTLRPQNDSIAEDTEAIAVSGTAGTLVVTPASVTLIDNDVASTAVTLSVEPESVDEDAGPTTVTVTATLDASAGTSATSVDVTVTGETATAVDDFASVNGFTVTIEAGSTSGSGTFTLAPVDDTVAEGDETISVNGSATGLSVTPTAVRLTDNDTRSTAVTLSVSPDSVGEGAGPTTVTVTATLNASPGTAPIQVTVAVAGGTATAGDDFTSVSPFVVTIPAEMTSGTGTFTLAPINDLVAEDTETLTISGTEVGGLTVNSTSLELTDNDAASTGVTLSVSPESVDEGAALTQVTVTATLNASAGTSATQVNVTVSGGTATAGTDFSLVNPFTVTIEAGSPSGTGTFTLTPLDDLVAEGAESLSVNGTAGSLTVTPTTLELTDNDTASTGVSLSVNPASVRENAGSTTVTVTATLDASAGTSPTQVSVTVTGDTATVGEDFRAVTGFTVTIAAGSTSGTRDFALRPVNDTVAEGTETIAVSGTATGLTVTPAKLELTDDDAPSTGVTLTTSPSSVREDSGATTVTVTATLNGGASTDPTTVNVTVADGTATAGTDFSSVNPFTVTIEAGSTSGTGTFTLTPLDDAVAEETESLSVNGTAGSLTVTSAAINLTDNDTPSTGVTLSVNPLSVGEGAGAIVVTVTATLNASAGTSATTVSVTVASDTATAGDDFSGGDPVYPDDRSGEQERNRHVHADTRG